MCMHDEAAPHYIDMIDQTTLGHRFIKEEFDVTPRIGWQIDPFGHSAVQAYLLGAEVGFDSLFFGRIDYQDRAKRKNEKSLEVVWRGSKSLGSSAQIFAGAFPKNYEPPEGFYFEINDDSPIVQDNIKLFDYNVQERVNDFVAAALSQANITRTNHIMWTMGTDFKYQYAQTWFRNLDKLIHYVNQDGRVNALYSTPSIYTDAKYRENESWPLKTDDFFPYADRVNAYWTGYFTSRPSLKRYVRVMSGYYLLARQLEFFRGRNKIGPTTDTLADALAIAQHHDAVSGTEKQHVADSTPSIYTDAKYRENESWPLKTDDFFPYADRVNAYWTGYFTSRPSLKRYVRVMSGYYLLARQLEFFRGRNKIGPTTDTLADALAIAQHHDAVTGTEKQHVADDYATRLSIGYKESEELVAASLACMVESTSKSGCRSPLTKFQQCPLLNISYCPATEIDLSLGKKLVVVVYNSLGWKRDDVVRIPVINGNVTVQDSNGTEIESQLLPLANASLGIRNYYATAYVGKSPSTTPRYWLAFTASVPPLGFSTYVISTAERAAPTLAMEMSYESMGSQNDTIAVGPGNLKLTYSANEGTLTQYVNTRSLVKESIEQSYSYYSAHDGSQDPEYFQASGAYIFRPNGIFPLTSEGQIPLTVVRGPLLDEVHQRINSWIYQITRVYKEKEHAEVEFTVGPIPIDDGVGKEIVTKVTTALKSNKTFYTDSNGRDFIERIRDYRADWDLEVNQPVAGNYYPINLGIYMKDDSKEFSILVDRSVGGSSIVDGQLELMLHRRLLHDDSRGVAEALNEIVCVRDECTGLTIQGKYYLRIDPLGEGAKWRRSFGQEIYSPFLLAFTEQDRDKWTNFPVPSFSRMDPSYSLPDNIAVITLEELEDGKVLLRLAHLYEIGEDKDLSVTSVVELKKLFPDKKINKITEMSLSANQEREEMINKRLVWKVEGSPDEDFKVLRGGPVDPVKQVVELAPMEIRTFIIDFTSLSASIRNIAIL
ncbi:probable alpha-mannosidase At5g13980 isoform X2 [Camellia sinensis]|nr:probable alpha-mannosidase At5g13980 isoform X2 [Camellia sinensis]